MQQFGGRLLKPPPGAALGGQGREAPGRDPSSWEFPYPKLSDGAQGEKESAWADG